MLKIKRGALKMGKTIENIEILRGFFASKFYSNLRQRKSGDFEERMILRWCNYKDWLFFEIEGTKNLWGRLPQLRQPVVLGFPFSWK